MSNRWGMTFGQGSLMKAVSENSGPGKAFPGSPACYFGGRHVPALIACSPNGSITSEICKRLSNAWMLLVCIRAHTRLTSSLDSRLQVPFLWYVNDEEHKRNICIGLPSNGTEKGQVGDSSKHNEQWKTKMTREKGKLVLYKTQIGMDANIADSDAIPLINLVWPKSFARTSTNKNTIRIVPCKLLQDPKILETKTLSTTGSNNPPNPAMSPPDGTGRRTKSTPTDATTQQQPTLLVTTGSTDDVLEVSNVSGSSSITRATSTTREVLDNLNFYPGVAGDFTLDILLHLVKEEKATVTKKDTTPPRELRTGK
jgi:hypothetical protein